MEDQIIEAEYKEIVEDNGALCVLTSEIKYITEQMNRTLLAGIIEIGKRFEQAKLLVKHGKWGEYCERCTGYGQSMAENYIKVYKEYGAEQFSIFGDLSKSQSIGNLGVTKLLELTALPAEDREKFVEENNVTEDTTVKELRELIKQQKDDIADVKQQLAEKETELAAEIENKDSEIEEKDEEIARLKKELEQREKEPPIVPEDEFEKMMAEADKKAKETLQTEIDRLENEKKKAETEKDKLQKKLDTMQKDSDKKDDKIRELNSRTIIAEAQAQELKESLEKLQKESQLGANEKMVRLNYCFEETQNVLVTLKNSLDDISDMEHYDKLRAAITGQILNIVETWRNG